MRKKFSVKVDVIESKKKVFVYIDKKRSNIKLDEKDIREAVNIPQELGALKVANEKLFVFDIGDGILDTDKSLSNVQMTDLITSYGASSLEAAPEEVTDPQEEKPKTSRRTRKPAAKKPRTRRKTVTVKKETSE